MYWLYHCQSNMNVLKRQTNVRYATFLQVKYIHTENVKIMNSFLNYVYKWKKLMHKLIHNQELGNHLCKD